MVGVLGSPYTGSRMATSLRGSSGLPRPPGRHRSPGALLHDWMDMQGCGYTVYTNTSYPRLPAMGELMQYPHQPSRGVPAFL
jgi:hypothetical protein